MVRKLIAGAAVVGTLTFGLAGHGRGDDARHERVGHDADHGGRGHPKGCAKLPKIEHTCRSTGAKVEHAPGQGEAREAKLKAAGKTKSADKVADKIAKVEKRQAKVKARIAQARGQVRFQFDQHHVVDALSRRRTESSTH